MAILESGEDPMPVTRLEHANYLGAPDLAFLTVAFPVLRLICRASTPRMCLGQGLIVL